MTNHLIEHLRSDAATNQAGKEGFAPLSGWLLSTLVALEEDCGGTLLFAYKAGPLWRNAVAVAVATGNLDHHPESFLLRAHGDVDESRDAPSLRAQFAMAIQIMKPRLIVEAALDVLPPSLCGALKKIGNEPFTTPEAYKRLIDLLGSTKAEDRARRRVLEQVNERLTELGVLCILPIKPKCLAASTISGFRRDFDWEFEFEGMGAWD